MKIVQHAVTCLVEMDTRELVLIDGEFYHEMAIKLLATIVVLMTGKCDHDAYHFD